MSGTSGPDSGLEDVRLRISAGLHILIGIGF